jgi:hypothetical protein
MTRIVDQTRTDPSFAGNAVAENKKLTKAPAMVARLLPVVQCIQISTLARGSGLVNGHGHGRKVE